jgi:hypothetical protein
VAYAQAELRDTPLFPVLVTPTDTDGVQKPSGRSMVRLPHISDLSEPLRDHLWLHEDTGKVTVIKRSSGP